MPDTAPSIPRPPSSGTICVVGAGFMGCVIATLYAHHGHDVALCDMNTELLASFAERARPIAATFADDPAAVDAMLARVRTEPSLAEAVIGPKVSSVGLSTHIHTGRPTRPARLAPDSGTMPISIGSKSIEAIARWARTTGSMPTSPVSIHMYSHDEPGGGK